MKTFPFVYITKKPYKIELARISFNEHKPFLQAGHKQSDIHTHPRPISPINSKLEQVKNLPLFVLGNIHHFSREFGKYFCGQRGGEILQHKAQPRAPRASRRAAVKQPFNKALKCHRPGHIKTTTKKKSYENKCLSNNEDLMPESSVDLHAEIFLLQSDQAEAEGGISGA